MDKRFFNAWRIGILVVFVVGVVLYLPSLLGGAIWDDDDLLKGSAIGGGTLVGAFTKPFLGHYFRPLTSASFVLDSSFAKSTPFYYHQTNILLHALTAVLVCLLAYQLTGSRLAGFLSGLFFGAQPMQVGAAAWIGGRTDVLSTFFIAGFLCSLVKYYEAKKAGWLVLSVLMFALAALSKEQAVVIFLAAPISVFAFGSRKWGDAVMFSLPFFVAAVAYFSLWAVIGVPPTTASHGFLYSLIVALRTTAHYSLAFMAPTHLSLMTFTLENYRSQAWIVVGLAMTAAFAFLCIRGWKKHRPLVWVALCGLFVYIPISNFPPVPSFVVGPYRVAECGPSVACLLGIAAVSFWSGKRYLATALMGANLVAGAAVTWWGIHLWLKPLDLFTRLAEADPHFMVGVGNHAHSLDLENRSGEALGWTQQLLRWIFDSDDWARIIERDGRKALTPAVMKRLQSNSGVANEKVLGWFLGCNSASLSGLKRMDEARLVAKDAILIAPNDARLNFAYGQLLFDKDRKRALHYWEVAITLVPNYTQCATALAHERLADHRYGEAVRLLDSVMTDAAWNTRAWLDLSDAKFALKDYQGAKQALEGAQNLGLFPIKEGIAKRLEVLSTIKIRNSDRQQNRTKSEPKGDAPTNISDFG